MENENRVQRQTTRPLARFARAEERKARRVEGKQVEVKGVKFRKLPPIERNEYYAIERTCHPYDVETEHYDRT